MRLKMVALCVLCFAIVIGSLFVANQINNTDNDTWDDTHWGDDVGEEEYSVPDEDSTNGVDDVCSGGICSTAVIVFAVALSPSIIQYRKQKNE